ncbi:restriction endonuclease subunit S [Xenorhabdus sp. Flor]|nr:restriction endonuclease subunit S [Xenorhabdus sp. Flor]
MTKGKLPYEWKKSCINDIATVVAGGTPKAANPDNFAEPGTEIAWLTPADLSGYTKKYIKYGARDLSECGYNSSSAKLMPKGTLLFSSRAPIGYVAIAANEISTNQGFKNFIFTDHIDPSFAYYYLRNIRGLAESLGTGTTFKEISGATAKKLPFVIAPLPEQKVITQKLDSLLSQVNSIKTHLEKIPQVLKKFRHAVLASAVSGHLGGLKDSNPLFENAKLKDLTSKIGSGSTPKGGNNTYKSEGIPLVRSLNIHTHYIKYEDLAFLDEEQAKKLANVKIQSNDVLLNITGASIGRVNIAPEQFIGGRVNQHVAIIRCKIDRIIPKYLHIFLASPSIQKWIVGENYGATRQALTKKMLEDLVITVPSIQQQTEIVRRVEKLFFWADSIEKQVIEAQQRVNNLTQSILAKSFRGELTEQWRKDNPDLISGENSAESLLKKIKAERALAISEKPTKRGRKKS